MGLRLLSWFKDLIESDKLIFIGFISLLVGFFLSIVFKPFLVVKVIKSSYTIFYVILLSIIVVVEIFLGYLLRNPSSKELRKFSILSILGCVLIGFSIANSYLAKYNLNTYETNFIGFITFFFVFGGALILASGFQNLLRLENANSAN